MKKFCIVFIFMICFIFWGCESNNNQDNSSEIDDKEYVTVSFDSCGGSYVKSQRIEIGTKAIKPLDPEKEDYVFIGWYYRDEVFDFDTFLVTRNITLKAIWELNQDYYIVDFDSNGGSFIGKKYLSSLSEVSLYVPEREGFNFLGWDYYDLQDRKILLVAKWIEKGKVTITFDTEGGSNVESQVVERGSHIDKPDDPVKENSKFLGWYDGDTKWMFDTKIVLEDKTLVAKWIKVFNYEVVDNEITITGINDKEMDIVVIPEYIDGMKVTSIGPGAFQLIMTGMISVTIPSGVKSIGEFAFFSCGRLVEVINKSGLEFTIGSEDNGYVARYALQVIKDKKDSKLSLTEDGFYLCDDGTDVYVVGYIGEYTDITIPSNVTKINTCAFYSEGITSVIIPDGVTSIGRSGFCNNPLTSITIPTSAVSIGMWEFTGCSRLVDVTYQGTKEQWDRIEKEEHWWDSNTNTIHCIDGDIVIDKSVD